MHKNFIFLLLIVNSNNTLTHSATKEKQEVCFSEQFRDKQLQVFAQQSKDIAQAQSDIYSWGNLATNFSISVATSAVIGSAMDPSGVASGYTGSEKVLFYGATCVAIAGALVAKDMWTSSNLTEQQRSVTAAITNLQNPKK